MGVVKNKNPLRFDYETFSFLGHRAKQIANALTAPFKAEAYSPNWDGLILFILKQFCSPLL